MAWLAVKQDGAEVIMLDTEPPTRNPWGGWMCIAQVSLPKGAIFRLIGRELSWQDEPVELTEETLVKPVEVTDEEIEKQAEIFYNTEISVNVSNWENGARWMRERMTK